MIQSGLCRIGRNRFFQLCPGAYNDETLIDFLSELEQLEQQRPVVLIWDGLPSHHSRRMRGIASRRHWLYVEPHPGYAHHLHPIEQVWGNLKSKELRSPVPRHHR